MVSSESGKPQSLRDDGTGCGAPRVETYVAGSIWGGATNRVRLIADPSSHEDGHLRLGTVLPGTHFAHHCPEFFSPRLRQCQAERAYEMIRAQPMGEILESALSHARLIRP